MTQTIKIRNEPAQHIGVANSAPCPEMNIVAKEITENGRYEARTEGVTGFDPVIVNVPSREEIGYENGYAAGYDEGYDKGYEVAGEYSVTSEDLTFSGDIQYLFYKGQWLQLINRFGSLMRFSDITNANDVFYGGGAVVDLSNLEINFDGGLMTSAFSGCGELRALPKASGSLYVDMQSTFYNCKNLPSNEINNFFDGLSYKENKRGGIRINAIFHNCYSVRNLTPSLDWLDNHINSFIGSSSDYTNIFPYGNLFNNCNVLDEITNLPVVNPDVEKTSNMFSNTFSYCGRLKNMMFKTDNGTPYSAKWKSQTIDLSSYIGYTRYSSNVTDYNAGITSDKNVNGGNVYQSLKNDPDWYTGAQQFSRYNHDSAVNTINSLPDTSEYLTSAGGTNTIKFSGKNGSSTDGGAINTLTAEEIAVATAKGWTVTLT